MFTIFDTYSAGISLLCSALFEAIAVSWFYGLKDFSNDIFLMLNFKPGLYWRICWKFISPFFILVCFPFKVSSKSGHKSSVDESFPKIIVQLTYPKFKILVRHHVCDNLSATFAI